MKSISFNSPHRRKHFEFFNAMDQPHFSITANVEITDLLPFLKENQLPVNLSLIYLIARTANGISEFKWRIRNDKVIEHPSVHPSFTVATEEADVFSFCTVNYSPVALDFINNAREQQEAMRIKPSLEDKPNRDDYLFLSAIPWVSFTGIQHAMHYSPADSVPRITWGKYFIQNGRIMMPLSVQAHHAVVDGRHIGMYFENFEALASQPKNYL